MVEKRSQSLQAASMSATAVLPTSCVTRTPFQRLRSVGPRLNERSFPSTRSKNSHIACVGLSSGSPRSELIVPWVFPSAAMTFAVRRLLNFPANHSDCAFVSARSAHTESGTMGCSYLWRRGPLATIPSGILPVAEKFLEGGGRRRPAILQSLWNVVGRTSIGTQPLMIESDRPSAFK